MSRTFKIAIAAFALSLTAAPAALAQTPANGIETVSVRVPYGDLDMSSIAGGQTLLKRIEGAAIRVCAKAVPRTMLKMRSPSTCRRETVDSTVRQLAMSTLTLAWSGKYPATNVASR